MGVRNLTSYINKNINLLPQEWKVDKKQFYSIRHFKNSNEKYFIPTKRKNSNKINIIIDAKSYFYFLGLKLNWFVYDDLHFLKLFRKHLCLFLAIENLENLIFVFDGLKNPIKSKTMERRQTFKFRTLFKFYEKICSQPLSNNKNLKPSKLAPMPLNIMTYIQYLCDAEKIFNKLKVKISVFEADDYIAKLANKINGYVISNDSDFYIYNIPGFISCESLKFPIDDYDFCIKYKLFTIDILINHLCIPKESLPIFATLCINDYLCIYDYPAFYKQMQKYECSHVETKHIKNDHFKKIVNFILDICESLNINKSSNNDNNNNSNNHNDIYNSNNIIYNTKYNDNISNDDNNDNNINNNNDNENKNNNDNNNDIRSNNDNNNINNNNNNNIRSNDSNINNDNDIRSNDNNNISNNNDNDIRSSNDNNNISNNNGNDIRSNNDNNISDNISSNTNDKYNNNNEKNGNDDNNNHVINIQKLIINELFKRKNKEVNENKEILFQKSLCDSIEEYNLEKLSKVNIKELGICSEITNCYFKKNFAIKLLKVINNNVYNCPKYLENFNNIYCWSISNDLRKKLYEFILLRNINGLKKDKIDTKNIPTKYTISERYRNGTELIIRKVDIDFNSISNQKFPRSINKAFDTYLSIFNSNKREIKKLPYFLIPLAIILRYYLLKKIENNIFINDKNDIIYSKFLKEIKRKIKTEKKNNKNNNDNINNENNENNGNNEKNNNDYNDNNDNNDNDYNDYNDSNDNINNENNENNENYENNNNDYNDNNDNNDFINSNNAGNSDDDDESNNESNIDNVDKGQKTYLHSYEFESLLASCIAALSLSFLNIKFYPTVETNISKYTIASKFTIEENVKVNSIDNNNMFTILNINNGRCLHLNRRFGVEEFQKDKDQFGNALQIFAEFCGLLKLNSNFLETLKLNESIQEFSSFFSMYHYLWEEAFYSMIEYFKYSKEKSISATFSQLFTVCRSNKNDEYIKFLNDIFTIVLNAILSNE